PVTLGQASRTTGRSGAFGVRGPHRLAVRRAPEIRSATAAMGTAHRRPKTAKWAVRVLQKQHAHGPFRCRSATRVDQPWAMRAWRFSSRAARNSWVVIHG